jgi:predicted DNA-binding transcriptional regulator YafY
VPWILTAAGDVEALEPASLRDAVRDAALRALDATAAEDDA